MNHRTDRARARESALARGFAPRHPDDDAPLLPDGARVWIMTVGDDGTPLESANWAWADGAAWWSAWGWRAEDAEGHPVTEEEDDDDHFC